MSADLLQQKAIDLTVVGHCRMASWYDPRGKRREFACCATRMTPSKMRVTASEIVRVGDRMTSYFDIFGTLQGSISDAGSNSFLLDLELSEPRRVRLAHQLHWLGKKQSASVIDLRENPRTIPNNPHSTVVLADGAHWACSVIDMSVTGVAVWSDAQPEVGTPLAVGACVGRVVRCFASGFAVKFVDKQSALALERLLLRPPTV